MTDLPPYDCTRQGHVWLEANGLPYLRHRGRSPGLVDVACRYCPATASLEAYAANVTPPEHYDSIAPVDNYTQAQAKLAQAALTDTGPAVTN